MNLFIIQGEHGGLLTTKDKAIVTEEFGYSDLITIKDFLSHGTNHELRGHILLRDREICVEVKEDLRLEDLIMLTKNGYMVQLYRHESLNATVLEVTIDV